MGLLLLFYTSLIVSLMAIVVLLELSVQFSIPTQTDSPVMMMLPLQVNNSVVCLKCTLILMVPLYFKLVSVFK